LNRRDLLILGGVAAVRPRTVLAQQSEKTYRLGFLGFGTSVMAASTIEGLGAALGRRGYSVGNNLLIEARYAEGRLDRLPGLVKELIDIPVDVIAITGYPAARAAKDGTTTVPIVLVAAGDPVQLGLVASYSHPGGNITGVSDMPAELSTKRLELIMTAVPGLKRVAVLYNASDAAMIARYQVVAAAASTRGISVQALGVREPDDFASAFAAMSGERPDGILMVTDILTMLNRKRVFEFAAANRIPAIYEFEVFARDGGLMSYGAERSELVDRAVELIDRILRGAKPADLPIEQPAHFRFIVNLKTAKALGLEMPATLLGMADDVID
jgi:putative tryptophan/tyrosine transport system substrate-binding protein